MSTEDYAAEELPGEVPPSLPADPAAETDNEERMIPEETPDEIRTGLRAAMEGGFRAFCRERGLYEGDLADRINAVFLDCLGDVVLEADGTGFRFIEEYREDAEEWLRAETKR